MWAQYPDTDRRTSAIDGRTTRHPGYAISQRKRKLVEQALGWMKTVGLLRKLHYRGGPLVDLIFTFHAAAYNLVRRQLPAGLTKGRLWRIGTGGLTNRVMNRQTSAAASHQNGAGHEHSSHRLAHRPSSWDTERPRAAAADE
jgi:hypothetical protein